MAIAVAPLTTAVLSSVDEHHVGTASGLNSAVSRAGGLIATALLGIVLSRQGAALVAGFHGAALVGVGAGVGVVADRLRDPRSPAEAGRDAMADEPDHPSLVTRLRIEAHAVWLAARDPRTPWPARLISLLIAGLCALADRPHPRFHPGARPGRRRADHPGRDLAGRPAAAAGPDGRASGGRPGRRPRARSARPAC